MGKKRTEQRLDLVYPLYLDVPMMTSFVAAIQDGIAYGSDVTQRKDERKAVSAGAEARAGMPFMGVLSTLLSLDLRGKITGDKAAGEGEEIRLVRRHTEASLFMRLRQELKDEGKIIQLNDLDDIQKLKGSDEKVLVEITGEIFRSPLSEILEAVFRVLEMLNVDLSLTPKQNTQSSPRGNKQQKKQQAAPEPDILELDQDSRIGFQLMQRIKDDLATSKVVDVIMRPSALEELSVVIALATEFLPEGAFDNLLSGDFTVLGKVTRIVEGDDTISMYQRTMFNNVDSSDFDEVFDNISKNTILKTSGNPMTITAPALQLMPLAIYT